LAACTGECDADSQCAAGLKCFQRSNSETIPGCTGAGAGKDWDYCYDPGWSASPKPTPLGGTNDAKAKNLEACIGECDADSQCKAGLKCFQRTGFTPVPGCSGSGSKDWDYCYDPTGSATLSGGNAGSAKNLAACTGECDADSQCAAGLKCFQRSNSETIPGCTGAGSGKDWDYCYDPKWQPMTGGVMNSAQARKWKTSDGSPWWLRSRASREPNGNYYANCYMGLKHGKAWEANDFNNLKFDADKCKYHSASYYCQHIKTVSTTPKKGSPAGCQCKVLELTGKYSAGALLKCENCLEVSKSTQKNSCPEGTKLWAPRNRDDWKTFLDSGLSSLRAPNWIVDVTNPKNGPGCCGWSAKSHNFNSGVAQQAAWKTADGAPWWLRSTKYNEPNGDYKANCYLDLWKNPKTPDEVQWNDGNCNYKSKSYYCQPEKKR